MTASQVFVSEIIGKKSVKPTKRMLWDQVVCPDCKCSEGIQFAGGRTWICKNCTESLDVKATFRYQPPAYTLSHFGVDDAYTHASLGLCNRDEKTKKVLCDYARNPSDFLILSGTNGTGKTYTACAIMQEYLKSQKCSCRFVKATNLYMEWQSNYQEGRNPFHFVYKFLSDIELLIIDDLGITKPTEAFLGVIYSIFDHRKSHSRSCGTVITTNLSAEQLDEIYGDQIFSRISSGKYLNFHGSDLRFNAI